MSLHLTREETLCNNGIIIAFIFLSNDAISLQTIESRINFSSNGAVSMTRVVDSLQG